MSMNRDIDIILREQRRRELMVEAGELRRAKSVARRNPNLGRRAIGRLGSIMVAAGSRLERVEHGSESIAYDM